MATIELKEVRSEPVAVPRRNGVVFRIPAAGAGVMLMASLGFQTTPPRDLFDINLAGLRQAAESLEFFGYRGCDADYHYFSMPDSGGVRLPQQQLDLQPLPIELGLCLFVTFVKGRLTIPDPLAMASIDPPTCDWALGW